MVLLEILTLFAAIALSVVIVKCAKNDTGGGLNDGAPPEIAKSLKIGILLAVVVVIISIMEVAASTSIEIDTEARLTMYFVAVCIYTASLSMLLKITKTKIVEKWNNSITAFILLLLIKMCITAMNLYIAFDYNNVSMAVVGVMLFGVFRRSRRVLFPKKK